MWVLFALDAETTFYSIENTWTSTIKNCFAILNDEKEE